MACDCWGWVLPFSLQGEGLVNVMSLEVEGVPPSLDDWVPTVQYIWLEDGLPT